MYGKFDPIHYGSHFDLPDLSHGTDYDRALDKSQNFSNQANYLIINSETFVNPIPITVNKSLSFRKMFLLEYAIHGVPITGDIPNFTHYDITFEGLNDWTLQNWIHICPSSSKKLPLFLDVGDVTHRILNPPRLITEVGISEMKNFKINVYDTTGNLATFTKIALLFYLVH
jgi:hypothetical protein